MRRAAYPRNGGCNGVSPLEIIAEQISKTMNWPVVDNLTFAA
jgi:hypothetical protein